MERDIRITLSNHVVLIDIGGEHIYHYLLGFFKHFCCLSPLKKKSFQVKCEMLR
jgi:hypothetical protein